MRNLSRESFGNEFNEEDEMRTFDIHRYQYTFFVLKNVFVLNY